MAFKFLSRVTSCFFPATPRHRQTNQNIRSIQVSQTTATTEPLKATNPFDTIPQEIATQIFLYLSLGEILKISSVSKTWKLTAEDAINQIEEYKLAVKNTTLARNLLNDQTSEKIRVNMVGLRGSELEEVWKCLFAGTSFAQSPFRIFEINKNTSEISFPNEPTVSVPQIVLIFPKEGPDIKNHCTMATYNGKENLIFILQPRNAALKNATLYFNNKVSKVITWDESTDAKTFGKTIMDALSHLAKQRLNENVSDNNAFLWAKVIIDMFLNPIQRHRNASGNNSPPSISFAR